MWDNPDCCDALAQSLQGSDDLNYWNLPFSQGFPMASTAMDFRTSLIPIFMTRLKILRAIAPGLRDLPAPTCDELQSLLERAEAVVQESVGPVPLSR